jgi:peptidyl-prolyl cis-trans isomerase D
MAIIGSIQKHSKIVIIIIGFALLAFVVGSFTGKNHQASNFVGEINGDKIRGADFSAKVEEATEMRKQMSGHANVPAAESFQIRESVWNQMVSTLIMQKQYDKLGIDVSKDEMDDMITGKNPHQYIVQNFTDPKTGKFDPKSVKQFVDNLDKVDPAMRQRFLMIEKQIRDSRLAEKYQNLIANAYYVPKAFAKKEYLARNEHVSLSTIGLRYETVPDKQITLTDADYQKYYDDNKNRFEQEASRDLDYVVYDVKPSVEDMNAINAETAKIYTEFQQTKDIPNFVNTNSDARYDSAWMKKGSLPVRLDSLAFKAAPGTFIAPFIENDMYTMAKIVDVQSRPDSLKASHILLTFEGSQAGGKRTKEVARKLADSILMAVKQDPKKLLLLAMRYSDDPSAKSNLGDLGWFNDGSMVPVFNNACVNGKVGDIVLVESQFGYHIIDITAKTPLVKKVRMAIVVRKVEAGNETFAKAFSEASAFAGDNINTEAFEKAVTAKGLNKRTMERIRPNDGQLPGLDNAREVIRWAFTKKTELGNVSQVFDCTGKYVVATLKMIREKGIAPLEQIKNDIKSLVMRDKKAEVLLAKMDKVAASKDFGQMAKTLASKIDTIQNITFASPNLPFYGREPAVVGTSFGMQKGQISKPIKGEVAVFLIKIDAVDPAVAAANYDNEKSIIANNFRSRVYREVYQTIMDKTKIVDNRIVFY